ncbi:unnamed protein product [Colias eurytheme]|nr:unnamed protein product [Colias eurytheme]
MITKTQTRIPDDVHVNLVTTEKIAVKNGVSEAISYETLLNRSRRKPLNNNESYELEYFNSTGDVYYYSESKSNKSKAYFNKILNETNKEYEYHYKDTEEAVRDASWKSKDESMEKLKIDDETRTKIFYDYSSTVNKTGFRMSEIDDISAPMNKNEGRNYIHELATNKHESEGNETGTKTGSNGTRDANNLRVEMEYPIQYGGRRTESLGSSDPSDVTNPQSTLELEGELF